MVRRRDALHAHARRRGRRAVKLADGRSVPRDALFIRPALRAHVDGPAAALGCEVLARGLVRVDADGRTSVPGVWAAGNVVDPLAQVITADGAGSAAAIAISANLVEDDVCKAVQAYSHASLFENHRATCRPEARLPTWRAASPAQAG